MKLRLAKILNLALLSFVAALGVGRPAEAAYVVVNADPAFGSPFLQLGWRATGAVYVPGGCALYGGLASFVAPVTVTLSGGNAPFNLPGLNGSCNQARMQDVRVYFYNIDDPTKQAVEMLDIGIYSRDKDSKDLETAETQRLIDLVFDDGALVGFHTSLSLRLPASDILAGQGDYDFSLEFSSDDAHLVAYGPNGDAWISKAADVSLQAYVSNGNYTRAPDEDVVATVIPEPAALALTLTALAAAMGAGGLARRWRRV